MCVHACVGVHSTHTYVQCMHLSCAICRVFDKILAWTYLVQAKLWVSHRFLTAPTIFQNSNFIASIALTILAHVILTIVTMWPKSYHTTGSQSTFLCHLVCHKTLSTTLAICMDIGSVAIVQCVYTTCLYTPCRCLYHNYSNIHVLI